MLDYIRRHAKGWLGYTLIFFICLTFALWGIGDYLGLGEPPVAAVVNGQEIPLQEVENAYARYKANQPSEVTALDETILKQQLLNQLVNERLLIDSAKSSNLMVGDATLITDIKSRDVFMVDGAFSKDRFTRILRNNGYSTEQFLNLLEQDLITRQLSTAISDTAFVTQSEVEQFYQLMRQTRDITYAVVSPERFRDGIKITEDDLKVYYDAHQDAYMAPEKVKLAYVTLQKDNLRGEVSITEEALKNYYETNKSQYIDPEKREFAHILIEAGDTQQDKINTVSEKLKAGMPFEELAKQYSDDIATAQQGGYLGWLNTDEMPDEAFAKAAYDVAQVGDVSLPTESSYGVHFIKVLDIKPRHETTFAEAKTRIHDELMADALEKRLIEKQEKLSQLAFEFPDTLDVIREDLGLTVETTDWLTRADIQDSLSDEPKFMHAIFSDEVLIERINTEVITLADGQNIVVRVLDHEPSKVLAFDAVKQDVRQDYIEERALAQAEDFTKEIQLAVNRGDDMDAIAKQYNITWTTKSGVKRSDASTDRILVQKAFALPLSEEHQVNHITLSDGKQVLITINKIDMPNPPFDETALEFYMASLAGAQANLEYLAYTEGLREVADIKLKQQYGQ